MTSSVKPMGPERPIMTSFGGQRNFLPGTLNQCGNRSFGSFVPERVGQRVQQFVQAGGRLSLLFVGLLLLVVFVFGHA
jgi:hypothetical protein